MRDRGRGREHGRADWPTPCVRKNAVEAQAPTATITRSLDQGEEPAGGAVEGEAASCQGVRWLSRVSPCTYPQTSQPSGWRPR